METEVLVPKLVRERAKKLKCADLKQGLLLLAFGLFLFITYHLSLIIIIIAIITIITLITRL